jgi:hypothetical protein
MAQPSHFYHYSPLGSESRLFQDFKNALAGLGIESGGRLVSHAELSCGA